MTLLPLSIKRCKTCSTMVVTQSRFGRLIQQTGVLHPTRLSFASRRSFAVYAMGDGWTGAMGHDQINQLIPGHFDDDDTEEYTVDDDTFSSPLLVWDSPSSSTTTNTTIHQVSVGWGHTAIIKNNGKLYMVGRPHDFVSLLRLYRFPPMIRRWAVSSTTPSSAGPEAKTIVGSMISSAIGWATGKTSDSKDDQYWEIAKAYSYFPNLTEIDVPNEKRIDKVVCGAGVSAILGASGTLYTFGTNNRGQCGIGTVSNNVWTPQRVMGLSTINTTGDADRGAIEQQEPIHDVALGLQHGIALSTSGIAYSWGKATRGQLGRELKSDQETFARQIFLPNKTIVSQISSGMHHGALLTNDNQVYVWGKNMKQHEDGTDNSKGNTVGGRDAFVPILVDGLPNKRLKVLKISCGSHHTSILMEDGSVYSFGIAADTAVYQSTIRLIPPGVIEMPCRHFEAHQDRTTIVGKNGTQVIQVHLWKDERLREFSMFTPPWVDRLLDQHQDETIRSIHRGWLHTVVVTEPTK